MELLNESIVCFAFLQIYVFTDWGPDEETKFLFGWFVIGVVLLMTVMNLGIVLKEIARSMMLMAERYYRRTKHNLTKLFDKNKEVTTTPPEMELEEKKKNQTNTKVNQIQIYN